MLDPPVATEDRKMSAPASSIRRRAASRFSRLRTADCFFCRARHTTHSAVKYPFPSWTRQRKCCLSKGNELPHTLHVRSAMPKMIAACEGMPRRLRIVVVAVLGQMTSEVTFARTRAPAVPPTDEPAIWQPMATPDDLVVT